MTLTNEDREALKKYRIKLAYEAIEDAELLIDNNKLRLAVNRVYYGMFYILNALALTYQFKTSKHKGLIAWFNKTFIKDEKIDRKYGEIIRKAFKDRSKGDYVDFVTFEKSDVEKMLEDMKDFISTIESYIRDKDAG
jgi:uncharacterized protein (UPF0332 family)